MEKCNLSKGLFFTADPYSKIVDKNDRDTALIFGDGASVTYISNNFVYLLGSSSFGTKGKKYEMLVCRNNKLQMNGRGIYNFVAATIPKDFQKVLKENN